VVGGNRRHTTGLRKGPANPTSTFPVSADPGELPLPTGKLAYSDPIGRVIGPFARFLPDREFGAAMRIVTAVDPGAGVPGLPDWERIPTRATPLAMSVTSARAIGC
jgi:hypothetical protein